MIKDENPTLFAVHPGEYSIPQWNLTAFITLFYTCLNMFTLVYTCLHLFRRVYTCLYLFTLVNTYLHQFTLVYNCLQLSQPEPTDRQTEGHTWL